MLILAIIINSVVLLFNLWLSWRLLHGTRLMGLGRAIDIVERYYGEPSVLRAMGQALDDWPAPTQLLQAWHAGCSSESCYGGVGEMISRDYIVTPFQLRVLGENGLNHTDHHFNVRLGDPVNKPLLIRFDPDSVRLSRTGQLIDLAVFGNVDYHKMTQQREERSARARELAGELGDHWLRGIEEQEGWYSE